MSALSDKATWRHPISTSLLKSYGDEIDMLRILDLEVEALLTRVKKSDPHIFSNGEIFTSRKNCSRS